MNIEHGTGWAEALIAQAQEASFLPDPSAQIPKLLDTICTALGANFCTLVTLEQDPPSLQPLSGLVMPSALQTLDEPTFRKLESAAADMRPVRIGDGLYCALVSRHDEQCGSVLLLVGVEQGTELSKSDISRVAEARGILRLFSWCLMENKQDRKYKAQQTLERLIDAQSVVVDLINDLLQAPIDRIDTVIDEALARLGQFCGSDRTYLFVETSPVTLSNTHEWCAEGIAPMKQDLQDVPRDMAGPWWPLFNTVGHVYIADIGALAPDSELREILEMQGILSLLAVPLQMNGHLFGFMGYDAVRAHRDFLPGEIYLIKSVANVVATLLSRRNIEAQANQARLLKEQEQRKLEATLKAIPDILLELDSGLRITRIHANPNIVLPLPEEHLLNKPVEHSLPPHVAKLARSIQRELEGRDIAMGYRCTLEVNGQQRWYSISASRRPDDGASDTAGYVAIVRDVTESQLQQQEIERLGEIARNSTNLVILTDPMGRIEWVNPAFERRTGYQLAEVKGKSPGRLLQCDLTDPETVSDLHIAIKNETAIRREILNRTKTGELYWIEVSIQPLFDDTGELSGFMSVQTDMTQHRIHARSLERALKAEQDAREQLRSAVNVLQDAFIQFDAAQELVLCNSRYRDIFKGMEDVLVPGTSLYDFLRASIREGYCIPNSDDHEAWIANQQAAFKFKYVNTSILRIGSHWYRQTYQPTPDGGRIGILSDITELKDAESRALADRARAMDASHDGFVLLARDGRVTYANAAAARVFGRAKGQALVGENWRDLFDVDSVMSTGALMLPELNKNGSWTGKTIARRDGGGFTDVEVSVARNGEQGYLCILRDMTDALKAEAERDELRDHLALARRREEMAQIAAGLTHDFNNFLAAISSAASLMDGATPDDAKQLAERIHGAVDQASDLVRRLMDLGRQRDAKPEHIDLRAPVTDAIELVRSGLRAPLQLIAHLPNEPLIGWADATGLVQVVMNLCINARDALVETGQNPARITVALRAPCPEDAALDFQVGHYDPNMDYTCLIIQDNGPGMPPDVRDNIFTPYFSTKGEGGSGLGVPIVANAVQTHSGALSLRSAPGEGTIFTIMWPLHAPTEGRPSDDILRPTYPGLVDKTILLLGSDTPEERRLATALEATGAHVVPCVALEDAEAVLTEDPDSWDMLLVDAALLDVASAKLRQLLSPAQNGPVLVALGHTPASDADSLDLSGPVRSALLHLENSLTCYLYNTDR